MITRKNLSAIAVIGAIVATPVLADDGDVQHARLLLEQARTFGVPGVVGEAAGQIEAEREARREEHPDTRSENQKRWDEILESQSRN